MSLRELFKSKIPVIGVIHLNPTPGSPCYDGNMKKIYDQALKEAETYREHGLHALCVENFRDYPFFPDTLPPESIAALAAIGRDIKQYSDLPVGVNALRNDALSAMAIATAIQGDFIRVNIHMGAAVADQGIIEGKSYRTLRLRSALRSNVKVFADIHVKHASPLVTTDLQTEISDTIHRGLSDALIVSGTQTGKPVDIDFLKTVKTNTSVPVYIGSGITHENLEMYADIADGFFVGSCFKYDGKANNYVDETRVAKFMDLYKKFIEH
ncbi:BtpA/SgcQ family protein [bacterium]|nr:BtpA/SgcQ family protein [candidate division CSSED10-310 bacterium]